MNPIRTELIKKNPNTWKAFVEGNEGISETGENETLAIARLLVKLQGRKIRTWNGAFYLAAFCWLSSVIMPWLIVTGYLTWGEAWGFWAFFLILGILSGSYSGQK